MTARNDRPSILRRRTSSSSLLVLAGLVAAGVIAVAALAAERDPNLPQIKTKPVITALQVGQTITVTPGEWGSATPLGYFIQWVRSDGKGHWVPIPGATKSTYTPSADDIGSQLFAQVKAVNKTGPTWANSLTTSFVTSPTQASGAVKLPDGRTSVPASAVSLPNRLIVKSFRLTPGSLRSDVPVFASFTVTDSAGHPVSGALVSIVGVPFGALKAGGERATSVEGVVTFQVAATSPTLRVPGNAAALFVRARAAGGNVLTGVSAARLVKLPLAGRK